MDIGGGILAVLEGVLGSYNKPIPTLLFAYIFPIWIVFLTLADMLYLMGFMRKTTAHIVAAIVALMGARFGLYEQVAVMTATMFGVNNEGGLWLLMFINVVIGGMLYWVLGQVLIGFKMAQSAVKNIAEMKGGVTSMTRIGNKMVEVSEKRE